MVSLSAGNSGICPHVAGNGRPSAVEIFSQTTEGSSLPEIVGRVMFLPRSELSVPDMFARTWLSNGTRLRTTWPFTVWIALLSPLSTATTCCWALRVAFTQNCWNCGVLRTLLTWSLTKPFIPLAIGPARAVIAEGTFGT